MEKASQPIDTRSALQRVSGGIRHWFMERRIELGGGQHWINEIWESGGVDAFIEQHRLNVREGAIRVLLVNFAWDRFCKGGENDVVRDALNLAFKDAEVADDADGLHYPFLQFLEGSERWQDPDSGFRDFVGFNVLMYMAGELKGEQLAHVLSDMVSMRTLTLFAHVTSEPMRILEFLECEDLSAGALIYQRLITSLAARQLRTWWDISIWAGRVPEDPCDFDLAAMVGEIQYRVIDALFETLAQMNGQQELNIGPGLERWITLADDEPRLAIQVYRTVAGGQVNYPVVPSNKDYLAIMRLKHRL